MIRLFLLIVAIWFILSGFFKPLFIIFAVVSSLISLFLYKYFYHNKNVKNKKEWKGKWRHFLYLKIYSVWLIKEIFISSFKVSLNMWKPKLKINSKLKPINLEINTDIAKTIFAHSITLTPGTVTIFSDDKKFIVHALDEGDLKDLENGKMANIIKNNFNK